jgi:hypothetical protein
MTTTTRAPARPGPARSGGRGQDLRLWRAATPSVRLGVAAGWPGRNGMTSATRAAVERVAELNNKLAVVVVNAELLAEVLGHGEAAERALRAARAGWEAAEIAQEVARGLLGEPPLAGAPA